MISYLISILFMAVIFTGLLFTTILTPYDNYKNFFVSKNQIPFSHISKSEFEMANWLKDNVNVKKFPNALAISDYGTSYMIRGITDLNTTADRLPNMSNADWENMQKTIQNIFSQRINS